MLRSDHTRLSVSPLNIKVHSYSHSIQPYTHTPTASSKNGQTIDVLYCSVVLVVVVVVASYHQTAYGVTSARYPISSRMQFPSSPIVTQNPNHVDPLITHHSPTRFTRTARTSSFVRTSMPPPYVTRSPKTFFPPSSNMMHTRIMLMLMSVL